MPRPSARRARWLRTAARAVTVTTLCVLVAGCSAAGGAQTGNARATLPDDAEAPAQSGGSAPGGAPSTASASPRLIQTNELAGVYQQIVQSYVGTVDHAALVESAVAAVREAAVQANALPPDLAPIELVPLPTGDPARDWTVFARAYDNMVTKHPQWAAQARPDRAILRNMVAALNDEEAQIIESSGVRVTGGTRISGIGIFMTRPLPTDPLYISEVFRGSPASAAGLKPGDQIVSVDGVSTSDLTTSQVSGMVQGQEGAPVTLSIVRGGQPPVDLRITRAAIEMPHVEVAVRPDGFGVMRIRAFGDGDAEAVQRLLVTGRSSGIRGWILDLRGNTGGSMQAMTAIAVNFLDRRPVAIATDRNGQRVALQAQARPAIAPFPFAVVVDRATTSWGEVLAASVKEYRAGPVVGGRTAGSVGVLTQPLSDGSAVQFSVARIQTPGGAPIGKQGVQPDLEAATTLADLQQGDDPPVRRAVELLTAGPSQITR